jgi:hypothetical protein
MISDTFNELRVEFDQVIEYANCSGNLAYRKELITQARNVLNRARNVWQDELKSLRNMLQTLDDADRERIKLAHREKIYNRL